MHPASCPLHTTLFALYDFDLRATHTRTLLPAALASVSFGFVLVRVRIQFICTLAIRPHSGGTIHMRSSCFCLFGFTVHSGCTILDATFYLCMVVLASPVSCLLLYIEMSLRGGLASVSVPLKAEFRYPLGVAGGRSVRACDKVYIQLF